MSGSLTLKVEPRPAVLSTSITVPWACATTCEMARPSPVPGMPPATAFDARKKRLKI
jgi:hypothetical protein